MAQRLMGAAALFACVAGKLDAINGEHLASDQALGIAGHQHLAEQGFDLVGEATNKLGNVGVAGLAVATAGDELDVTGAGLLDVAAGYQALAVGQQDDLEHDARVVGRSAHFIVLEFGIQGGQIKLVVDQVVQCESEAAGDDLFRQYDWQQEAVAVLGFVTGHDFYETFATYS